MLTDIALKDAETEGKDFTKLRDRDGMYVHVTPKGAVSFRLDYWLNGRRENVYLGYVRSICLVHSPERERNASTPGRRLWTASRR